MRNSIKHFTILFILLTFFCYSFGQHNEGDSYFEYAKETAIDDANQIFDLGLGLLQAPLFFTGRDFLYGAAMGMATSSLFLIDQEAKAMALRNQTARNDKIFEIDRYFNGRTGSYAGAGLYISGFLFKQEKIRQIGLHMLETLFIANSITSFLKLSFGRLRPYGGDDHMSFKAFRGKESVYRALPSGHTSSAFAISNVMAMSIDNIYWKTIWYGAAAMVGMARIYHNVHWLSDTFLAAVISYNAADFVVNFNNDEKKGFKFYPSISGFQIRFYF